MKEIIIDLLQQEVSLSKEQLEELVEIPPKLEMGDFAFPCFSLAKEMKKNPLEIAQDLTEKLRKDLPKEVSNVEQAAAYVNFFVDKKYLAKKVLKEVESKAWGELKLEDKKIGIEYPSPNTNKALHVGHLRNMAIGEAITRMVKNVGNTVYHLNLFNDRGILISKSMIGYEKYAKDKTPDSEEVKGDKFVGDLYVKFSIESKENPELEDLAREKLVKWENEDEETRKLWEKLNSWAYKGMQETFDKFGLSKIDKNYYESDIYKRGKDIVDLGLKKGLFEKRDDGSVIINLEDEKLGEKVLLRSDGTSVYITQDLFLAEEKINDFNLDSSYYVVGSDQEYHFKVLFSILEKLGIRKDWRHLSYGMVSLPSGKMKSREGTAVSADELIEETQNLAKEGLSERDSGLSQTEIEERSLVIALAAIKYMLLKVDIHKGIIFNPKEALSFEGDTGPYLLYSYARASSIMRKATQKKSDKFIDLKDEEIALIKKIEMFPEVVKKSYQNLAPNLIANYSFELAQNFNEFYHACPVMKGDQTEFRLSLVDAFRRTLHKSLDLLGIQTLEEM